MSLRTPLKTCPDKFNKNWQIAFHCAFDRALMKYKEIYQSGQCITIGTWYIVGIHGFSPNSKFIKELKIFLNAGYGKYNQADRYSKAYFSLDFRHFLTREYQKCIINDPKFEKAVYNEFVKGLQDIGVPGSENLICGVIRSGDL